MGEASPGSTRAAAAAATAAAAAAATQSPPTSDTEGPSAGRYATRWSDVTRRINLSLPHVSQQGVG